MGLEMKKIVVSVVVTLGLITGCASHDYGTDLLVALGCSPPSEPPVSSYSNNSNNSKPRWYYDEKLEEKGVSIGMSGEDVISKIGWPDRKNRSMGTWGTHEQWVYGYTYTRACLYFENGVLTGWQDFN